jgi:hypothetical protein
LAKKKRERSFSKAIMTLKIRAFILQLMNTPVNNEHKYFAHVFYEEFSDLHAFNI